jgi:mycoredoxin
MPKKIVMYTSTWCGDCRAASRFLDKHHIEYQTINIDHHPDAARFVMQVNHGRRKVPTFDIDGTYLECSPFTPEKREKLAEAIGIES